MIKRLDRIEGEMWAMAEPITLPSDAEFEQIIEQLFPLDTPIWNLWIKGNLEAQKCRKRSERIEKAIPSIHPAFLPDANRDHRFHQWVLHHSREYAELIESLVAAFIAHVQATYDLSAGLLNIALQLFAPEIDEITAVQDYVGYPLSREAVADALTRQWDAVAQAHYKNPDESDEGVWLLGAIEHERELYGRAVTGDELKIEWAKWRQVTKEMKAGKPAGELTAYLRGVCESWPRKIPVGSFR